MTLQDLELLAPTHPFEIVRSPADGSPELRSSRPRLEGDRQPATNNRLLKRLEAYLDTSSGSKKSPLTGSELMALATGGAGAQETQEAATAAAQTSSSTPSGASPP